LVKNTKCGQPGTSWAWAPTSYELNRAGLDHLIWAFRAASPLLVLEVAAWGSTWPG